MRLACIVLMSCLLLVACGDNKQSAGGNYEEGKHYRLVKQVHPEEGLSVVEFFWYGCTHCRDFEPVVNEWLKTKPEDVSFRRVPAMWHNAMVIHARAFYIGQGLAESAVIHEQLFDFIINLADEPTLQDHERKLAGFFSAYGLSEKQFDSQFNAPELGEQLNQDYQLMQDSGMSSTPSFMVAGKYLVDNTLAETRSEVMSVVDYLLDKERAARLPGAKQSLTISSEPAGKP